MAADGRLAAPARRAGIEVVVRRPRVFTEGSGRSWELCVARRVRTLIARFLFGLYGTIK